jgi:hypothetical protein
MRFDGTQWTELGPAGAGFDYRSVWGESADDFYVTTGGGQVLHYANENLSVEVSVSSLLYDIWGSSTIDIWAVGQSGRIVHFDGASWAEWPRLECNSGGVWGSSPTDVYAVGACWYGDLGHNHGGIYHFDGTEWTPTGMVADDFLQDVWGTAADDVWVVGRSGLIYHFDGTDWSRMEGAGTRFLWGVGGNAH